MLEIFQIQLVSILDMNDWKSGKKWSVEYIPGSLFKLSCVVESFTCSCSLIIKENNLLCIYFNEKFDHLYDENIDSAACVLNKLHRLAFDSLTLLLENPIVEYPRIDIKIPLTKEIISIFIDPISFAVKFKSSFPFSIFLLILQLILTKLILSISRPIWMNSNQKFYFQLPNSS